MNKIFHTKFINASIIFIFITSILAGCHMFTVGNNKEPSSSNPIDEYPEPPGEFTLVREGNNWVKKDDDSGEFSYNGSWELINGEGYMETMHFTSTPRSRLSVPINGRRARIYGKKDLTWGLLQLLLI